MDFDFYRNFIAVAEAGNISAAAKQLSLVQPALSAQIKTLEKYYGVQLFKTNRGKRRIELTEAGEAFLQQAKLMCSTEDSISLTMQSFSQKAMGTLRVGVSHVRSEYFLQRYLIPFAQNQPQINYQFHNAAVAEQQELLAQGLIDFAFANAPLPPSEDLASIKVGREYFYVYYEQNKAVPWGAGQITPAMLTGLPLCCNYGSYGLLRSVCQEYGVTPNVIFIATAASSALAFAASGLACAAVPALPGDPVPSGLRRVLLQDDKLTFPLELYWNTLHRLSPAAQLFLEFFQKQIQKRK